MQKSFTKVLSIILCASFLLTACKKEEKIEYVIPSRDALNEALSQRTESGKSVNNTSIMEKIGLTELSWNEDVPTSNGTISIKASVTVPDDANMYTMIVKEHYPNNDDKKRIVSALFDEGTVIADVEDYSINHYTGKRDGIDYSLDFYVNQDTNRCVWYFKAMNSSDLHAGAQNLVVRDAEKIVSGDNKCKSSEEEIKQRAEKLTYDIGFSYMKANFAYPLEFVTGGEGNSYNVDYDGYAVVLTRGQGKTITDGFYYMYYDESGEKVSYDPESKNKPYEKERLRIELNDKGIYSISGYGWMEEAGAPHVSGLISYSEVQDSFRNIIKEELKDNKVEFEQLYLTYSRIPDAEVDNKYHYIPSWCLTRNWTNEEWGIERECIFISAIDGMRIYPVTNGDVDFFNIDWHDDEN